ncbi:MAG: type VII toxin-antitoxin system HepT family RNase toxin [Thermoanaerobaculia bacterium]
MADVNPEYLLEQFQLIEEYLRRAQGIAGRSRDEYLRDPYAVDASVRELVVLFETSHNVAKHLISREGWRAPASKAEAFEILGEQGILPEDLVDAFREASRFRNLVTYQTTIIRDETVYQILQDHLTDFERFLSLVARWLKVR